MKIYIKLMTVFLIMQLFCGTNNVFAEELKLGSDIETQNLQYNKENRFIIKYKTGSNKQKVINSVNRIIDKLNFKNIDIKNIIDTLDVIEFSNEIFAADFISELKKINANEIEYIQPDNQIKLTGNEIEIGNFTELYNKNTYENQEEVITAIIDTGVDITHPKFADQTVQGYDFINNQEYAFDVKLSDNETHGTHIAGIIASVSPTTKIMPLKVFENGTAYTSDIINAIKYAESHGAQVVNCSWGSSEENKILEDIIKNSSMTFICAAGNNGTDISKKCIYPAAYNLENIISVASVSDNNYLSAFSNYSNEIVDIAAKGEDVYSTYPNSLYGVMSGTSMATGYVTGAVALYISKNGKNDVKNQLKKSADKYTSLSNKICDGNILNIHNYINKIDGAIIELTPSEDFESDMYEENFVENWNLFSSLKNVQICTGEKFSIILKSDGSVWSFGYNKFYGELGVYSDSDIYNCVPIKIPGLKDIVKISAVDNYCMALRKDGVVFSWGINLWGNLGDGTTTNRSSPLPVLNLVNIKDVFAGYDTSAAIDNNGKVFVWGKNIFGEIENSEEKMFSIPRELIGVGEIKKISIGRNFCVFLKKDNTVVTIGKNNYGQLGNGTTEDSSELTVVNGLNNICQIYAGYDNVMALTNDGTVYSWGNNWQGQLGNGTTEASYVPVEITNLENIVFLDRCIAVDSQGEVWYWSKTKNSGHIPTKEPNLSNILMVSGSDEHCLALDENGAIWAWGNNNYGQLGYGNLKYRTTPIKIFDMTNVKKVSAGNEFAMILKNDGTVWTWGKSKFGALGLGDKLDTVYKPTQIMELNDITDIICGNNHCLALNSSNEIYAWGYNTAGEIGNGTRIQQTVPVKLNLSGIVKISAGNSHSLAVDDSGNLYAWGNNSQGQIGDGTTERKLVPTLLSTITNVTDISAGSAHSVALKSDGTVWTWGGSSYIKDSEDKYSKLPFKIENLENVISVSSSNNYNLALQSNGDVYSWGNNATGQLGIGTTQDSYYPQKINDLSNIEKIFALNSKSCFAQKDNGEVYGWGKNGSGNLGNGTRATATKPILSKYENAVSMAATNYNTVFSVDSNGILFAGGGNQNGIFNSVVITSTSIPHKINDIYENQVFITEADFYSNTESITNIVNGNIEADVQLNNLANEEKEVSVIMILYKKDSDIVQEIAAVQKNISPFSEDIVSCSLNVPEDFQNYYIKIKLWDGIYSMNVLTSDVIFE